MNQGDPVIWTNPTTGKELPAVYKGSHGLWQIIETLTETGRLGLRYVHARDIRPITTSPKHESRSADPS